jgi:hypothetical protein
VAWTVSDPQVATAEVTGRASGRLIGVAPGEVTLQGRFSFQAVAFAVSSVQSSNSPVVPIRAVRVVP